MSDTKYAYAVARIRHWKMGFFPPHRLNSCCP